jgi:polysaccharide chain length determinant protein (PEP-CTERM system associated)
MNFDFKFYLSRFLRRIHYFAVIAVAISALGITLAYILPPMYQARATLLVESPQIPDDLASSTVSAKVPETLRIVQQQLTTRANLLDMARRLNIYGANSTLTPDQIVADMRSRISIRRAGTFVNVSFSSASAQQSAEVTNDIVSQILQASIAMRTEASGETLAFFDQEVTRLSEDLARQSDKILQFKLANKDSLPDSLAYRRARQGSQQERLLQIDRDIAALNDRRTKLIDLYERTGQVGELNTEPRTPEEKRLRDLKRRLDQALLVYSPTNPQVKVLQAQIAQLEPIVAEQIGASTEGQLSPFEVQMADIDGQIAFKTNQKSEIEAELETLQKSIDATPANAITLDVLERDYKSIETQYSQAVARQAQAATGDRIEAMSKGQRISVIEQAVVPGSPDSPNRPLIAAAGVGAGVGLGFAVVFLLEFLNRSIQRPIDLANRLGLQTFGAIPYIRTAREQALRRALITLGLLFGFVGVPATLYAIHVFYLPLDLLLERAVDKSGLGGFLAGMNSGT